MWRERPPDELWAVEVLVAALEEACLQESWSDLPECSRLFINTLPSLYTSLAVMVFRGALITVPGAMLLGLTEGFVLVAGSMVSRSDDILGCGTSGR
jgi:hypothetical protein